MSLRRDKFSLNDKIIEKEIVDYRPSVGIVPVQGSNVILVRQYRHAAGKRMLEIPAGKMEKGESPLQAAKREMSEEIGFAGTLTPLVKCYLAPGYDTEFMRVYVATNLKRVPRGTLDDDEQGDIAVSRLPVKRVVEMCYNGKIQDCKTIAAILAYSRKPIPRG